ncbi:MAG: kelch repeat-containing protein [Candidatus Acidiferrum sp.]
MKAALKLLFLMYLTAILALVSACSGVPGTSGGGGTTTTGPFTIGGTVSGLTGTGLVLQDNGADNLSVTAPGGSFMFPTSIANNGSYLVTVLTQPTNPTQTCTVSAGNGTATANVTAVAVTCTTVSVTATIGGTVSGLVANSSVVLQDNGGDSLTITANGAFTFKTPVTGPTDAYAVTVLTQPVNPNQICTVANGSGTASANVTNVAVTCVLSYSIGGTVTGLVGSGLILENSSDSEQLKISPANGNQAFTFTELVPTGTAYTVTIFAQPTSPAQTCVVTTGTGSGTATANVTTVAVVCPAITYSVGGTIVGLAGIAPSNGPLTDNSFALENNLGNTLIVTENGPFTFATPVALNDQYEVSVFTPPSTQTQGCTTWDYKGVVTENITNIVVDCAHDDWTWIDGTDIAGTITQPQYGSFVSSVPTTIPNPYTNTPGARYAAAGWTDNAGNMWLFGGEGWELSGSSQPATLDAPMNDLWVCPLVSDQCQWQLVGGYDPTVVGTTTVGGEVIANAENENQLGFYSSVGTAGTPGGRYGSATWTDGSGNLWLFGGNGNSASSRGLLNDLWEFNISSYTGAYNSLTGAPFTSTPGQWTWEGGTSSTNQAGIYTGAAGTLVPGARVNSVTWKDAGGNFWLFGGYGYDSNGNVGFLSDLWEYTGGNWVFVLGNKTTNQNGAYGQVGTPAAGNLPGGRQEAVGWADTNGNLWLFGGEGEDSVGTANGILNDLWVYNITNNQWTWVAGSSTANQTGVYGLQPFVGPPSTTGAAGTVGLPGAASSTLPGSRWGASAWVDKGGNFWLLGGWGLDSTGTNGNGALNDLWVYTPNATATQPGTWTWIKGSNTGSQNGLYGSLLRPYETYYIWTPGGRSNATHWVDGLGQLWLFGGEGYDSTGTTGNGYLNDMWRYLPYKN